MRRHTYHDKELMFNADNVGKDRKWLFNLLLSDTESDSEISDVDKYVSEMLKEHKREKRYREKYHWNPNISNWPCERRLEKEAEEQRKMDVELVEVKRQQRKLNFLITQTEFYAHFMSNEGELSSQEEQRILNQLDEEVSPRLAKIDIYDSELMKSKAQKNVQDAFYIDRNRTKEFDKITHAPMLHPQVDDASGSIVELPQPECFKGVLKGYQLEAMTWLAHLYDQGISGILVRSKFFWFIFANSKKNVKHSWKLQISYNFNTVNICE